jgi:hypothetical protein
MNKNKNVLLGLMMTGLLGACADSVINDDLARAPFIPETPSQTVPGGETMSSAMTFKFNPDSKYDGNPVEAMFPGQGTDAYGIDDIAKQSFKFDFEFTFKEIRTNKDETEKTIVGDATLFIEMIKPVVAKKSTRKKSKKKKSSEESQENQQATEELDIELFRNFESVNGVTVKNVKDIDYLEGRFADVDGEDSVIVLKAQRKHSKDKDAAQKNPWTGTVYVVEDSQEFKMGEFKGFFFNTQEDVQIGQENNK